MLDLLYISQILLDDFEFTYNSEASSGIFDSLPASFLETLGHELLISINRRNT